VRANFDRFVAIRRFAALDGLRAVSVIAVAWHHTSGTPGQSFTHKGFLGWTWVDSFFAISGFPITSLLPRERTAVGGISLRKFYARRTLRIFPLYYATLLAYIVLVAATRRHSPEGIRFFHHLAAFATYTGLARWPSHSFAINTAWVTAVALAIDLLCWMRRLLLDDPLAKAEPATLRYRPLHAAARLVKRSRYLILRVPETWPWAQEFAAAVNRVRAIP
jgi:peptidoglycan/LPS O-acetylase OafA/YrhL